MWVFGYGSLLWNPGFSVAEQSIATLPGYARSFCMRSIHHRGTEEDPGLVLALDAIEGTECEGLALRVEPGTEDETLAYLRERELISSAYHADHVQYCGGLPLEEQAQIIANAVGGRGPNTEYLFNTAQHLNELGLVDADLEWLVMRVRTL